MEQFVIFAVDPAETSHQLHRKIDGHWKFAVTYSLFTPTFRWFTSWLIKSQHNKMQMKCKAKHNLHCLLGLIKQELKLVFLQVNYRRRYDCYCTFLSNYTESIDKLKKNNKYQRLCNKWKLTHQSYFSWARFQLYLNKKKFILVVTNYIYFMYIDYYVLL